MTVMLNTASRAGREIASCTDRALCFGVKGPPLRVLPPGAMARVAVEQGSVLGWTIMSTATAPRLGCIGPEVRSPVNPFHKE